MTGPTPKTSVRDVPQARTATASFFLVSRSRASIRRRPAVYSAASSRRACRTAPPGSAPARIAAAWAAHISLLRPPGTSPQHRVQPAGDLGAGPAQVPVPPGPDLQHRRVIIGPDRQAGSRAQRRDGDRAGIAGIIFVHRSRGQQPHPGGQLGLHVQHPLPGGHQLLRQQVPQAGGAFYRPGPLRPGLRPGQQPLRLRGAGPHPQQSHPNLIRADRHRRVRALMRVHADHHRRHHLPLSPGFAPDRTAAGMPYSRAVGRRTSYEPHRGKVPAGRHVVRKPGHDRPAADMRARPAGTSERYDPNRNAWHRFFNKADIA
jgi:hypothetical protein